MQEYRNIFNKYFKRFDIKNSSILGKFHHSYRVMEYSKKIGESLNLNEYDIRLCEIIGLFHDIGRFEQWTKYKTYKDYDSIDHAALACEILKKENMLENINDIDKNIILLAIKNHNKYEIEKIDDEKILLFCKIIRDADKLDIMFEQANTISKIEKSISLELLDEIYNKKSCSNKNVKNDVDRIIRHLGFIMDLNFLYSINLLKEKCWFENKFNLLENYVEDKESVEKLKEFINKYVEEMTLC